MSRPTPTDPNVNRLIDRSSVRCTGVQAQRRQSSPYSVDYPRHHRAAPHYADRDRKVVPSVAGLLHPGRRAQKYTELPVVLDDCRRVDEVDVGEPGGGQLVGKALPVKSVVSVEVDLVGVEGAVGILIEVRDAQPA